MAFYGNEASRGGRKRAFSDVSRNDHGHYQEPQSYAPRPRFEPYRGHRGGHRGNYRGGQRGGHRGGYRGAGFHHQHPQQYQQQPPTTSTPPPAEKKAKQPKQSQSKAPANKAQKKTNGERKLPTHKRPEGKIFFIGSLQDWKIETSAVQSFYKREIQYVSRWDLGKNVVQLQLEAEALSAKVTKDLETLSKKNVVMIVVFLNHGLTDPKLKSF